MAEKVARGARIAWWAGLAGHVVMLLWFGASGLVAPVWAVACLLAIWVVLLLAGYWLRANHPLWMLVIPAIDVAVWVAGISAGDAFLDWTA
jgi:hypothetical protein